MLLKLQKEKNLKQKNQKILTQLYKKKLSEKTLQQNEFCQTKKLKQINFGCRQQKDLLEYRKQMFFLIKIQVKVNRYLLDLRVINQHVVIVKNILQIYSVNFAEILNIRQSSVDNNHKKISQLFSVQNYKTIDRIFNYSIKLIELQDIILLEYYIYIFYSKQLQQFLNESRLRYPHHETIFLRNAYDKEKDGRLSLQEFQICDFQFVNNKQILIMKDRFLL
ncbi:unnamed protein product [Paramecium sonneborni]|uniref:EF-hand domain-containing protein n=1 Tax=Paramecium sonneborni TaxID=65129 RepID=A0A8S1LDW8_9CILI|nr:unnamed protein product [Paramecium sonneborni]